MKLRNTALATVLIAGSVLALSACETDADMASKNLSVAAEQFEIERRIVFYDSINGSYMLEVFGRCSIEDQGNQLEVTCKTDDDEYKKHFLGLSDNVSYIAEQLEDVDVDVYHHRVIFKPETIIPNIDLETSLDSDG